MARSKSSGQWLNQHFQDEYVLQARRQGYRSRAVYKLEEIDLRDRIFRPGMKVLDLGAAPGGWSQYAVKKVGKKGVVVASDILEMEAIPQVTFIEGDFHEQAVLDRIVTELADARVDLVLSDMAPNMSGVRVTDQSRASYLAELALETVDSLLVKDGTFVVKLFHGAGFDEFVRQCRTQFKTVKVRKPKASRDRSREVYLVAQGFKFG